MHLGLEVNNVRCTANLVLVRNSSKNSSFYEEQNKHHNFLQVYYRKEITHNTKIYRSHSDLLLLF
jgi:hypothetical protein